MARSLSDLERGAIVVLPSATFPESELRKIVAIQRYEERLLCTTLLLANPDLRLVYITSLPIDAAIVEYYLRFLPDPVNARERPTSSSSARTRGGRCRQRCWTRRTWSSKSKPSSTAPRTPTCCRST